jgi:hypothetical protein
MVGTKVHVAYKINDPPLVVKPGTEIEGKIIVTNGEKKDKKLKKLFIELYDIYQALITRRDPESGEETESWAPFKKELKQWDIASNDKLKSGEKKEFPFTIEWSYTLIKKQEWLLLEDQKKLMQHVSYR